MGYTPPLVLGVDYIFTNLFFVKKGDLNPQGGTWGLIATKNWGGPSGGGVYDPYANPGPIYSGGYRYEPWFPFMNPWATLGNMKALLHFDGTPSDTTITDESGRPWTNSGLSSVLSADNPVFGATCVQSGGNIYAGPSPDFAFAKDDFTIESRIRSGLLTWNNRDIFHAFAGAVGVYGQFRLYIDGGNIVFTFDAGGPTYTIQGAYNGVSGDWVHVALVRESLYFYIYVNGTNVASMAGQPYDVAMPDISVADSVFVIGHPKE